MVISQKNAEGVKRLLLAGADPNTKDNAGWTPLVKQLYIFYGLIFTLLSLIYYYST